MVSCVVIGCKNYDAKVKKKDGISYHRFPNDPVRSEIWSRIIRKQRNEPNFKPHKSTRICSAHFYDKDLDISKAGLRRLKGMAIPFMPNKTPEPSEPEIKTNVLIQHKKTQDQSKSSLKTYMRKQKTPPHIKPEKLVPKLEKMEPKKTKLEAKQVTPEPKPEVKKKQPPVIKLQNLKRIDSISLIQNLRNFTGFIKLEPAVEIQRNIKLEPECEPEPICEPEPEPECVTEAIELSEQDGVFVKSEMADVNEEIYYQCDVCNTIFYTEDDFDIHYQSTHAMKVEPSAEQILEDHLVSDHIDDAGVQAGAEAAEAAYYYECEMCHKIFASEEYFNIHYNKMHGGLLALTEETEEEMMVAEETEECLTEEQAAENFTIETYKGSVPLKAPEQVIYYKCDLCKILYPSEKAYNTHFDKKHSAPAAPAGFRFIEQHLAPHEPPAPRPAGIDTFCCEFCPKTFNMKRSLQVHRKRVHVDKLPGNDGSAPSRNHNRSKVCDICGRAYNSNAALRYHQRRHTGEKPYPCTMCPKRFTMPMFLQIHLRTHTGEKPYECLQCPKAFTNKAALIRHDRVHTGVKPYPCPECGKYFTQSNSMKLHVSTVHLKLPAPYKSKNRRSKSEARALQLALKGLPRGGAIEEFQR